MRNLRKSRWVAVMLALLMVVSIIPSQALSVQAAKKATVKSVKLTKPVSTTLVLKKGKTYSLKTKLTVTGKKVSTKVKYTSSKKAIATVSSKGKVKAKKAGTTIVKVTSVANKKKFDKVKVIVGTPVTKVKLNKSSLELAAGAKFTLKKTITPKKASVKTVSYTSSNKAVATVTKKGVVTAKAAGSAVITAKAKDGTGKKAKCTVTVPAQGNTNVVQNTTDLIGNITARYNDTFDVVLNSPLAGTTFTANITGGGARNGSVSVDYVTTKDNQNYKLQLGSGVPAGANLNVTATNASGTETQSITYFPEMSSVGATVTGNTNVAMSKEVGIVSGSGDAPTWSLKSGVIPSGLSLDTTTNTQKPYLIGKADTVQNGTQFVLGVTDQYGRSTDCPVTLVIGSAKELAVYAPEETIVAGEELDGVIVAGGSGDYRFENRMPEAITGSSIELSDGRLTTGSDLAIGDYRFPMTVVDEDDPSIRKDFERVVHVVPGVKVSGVISTYNRTTNQDEVYSGAEVTFRNLQTGRIVSTYSYSNSSGNYDTHLVPGKYRVEISRGKRTENQGYLTVNGDMVQNYTFTSMYRVKIDFEVPDGADRAKSYIYDSYTYFDQDNQGNYFIYLPNGTYTYQNLSMILSARDASGYLISYIGGNLKAHMNFQVNGADTSIVIHKNEWFHQLNS